MKRSKRKIIIILFFCIFLFNIVFSIIDHHHNCTGIDCVICMRIKQNGENTVKLGMGLKTKDITIVLIQNPILIKTVHYKEIIERNKSLVKLKVMLRN